MKKLQARNVVKVYKIAFSVGIELELCYPAG